HAASVRSRDDVIATRQQRLGNFAGLGLVLVAWVLYAVYASPTQGWTFFLQLTVNGIILGSIYALIARGYSMVYGILKLLNFAHGDVYMIGAFIGYFIYTALGAPLTPSVSVVALFLLMLGAAALGCGLLGVGIERFGYRPLRNAPRIAPLITALGLSFLIQNSALLAFGAGFRNYDTFALDNGRLFSLGIHFHALNVSLMRGIVILAAAVLMVALT